MPEPTQVSYLVLPHEDDELSVTTKWASRSYSNFKVLLYTTQGEDTAYVDPATYPPGWDKDSGEDAPLWAPGLPPGKGTIAAKASRIRSSLDFLNKWSQQNSADTSRPSFATTPTGSTSRLDTSPSGKAPGAEWYVATNGQGVAIFADLGDSFDGINAPTAQDIVWLIQFVDDHRAMFGIPMGLPTHDIVGAYANRLQYGPLTVPYAHPNHEAVADALYNYTILAGVYNWGRTSSEDPDCSQVLVNQPADDYALFRTVDGTPWQAVGQAVQAFGWLTAGAFANVAVPSPPFDPVAGQANGSDRDCRVGVGTEAVISAVQAYWQRGGAPQRTVSYS